MESPHVEGESSTSLGTNRYQSIIDKLAVIQRSLDQRAQDCVETQSATLAARQQEDEGRRALKMAKDAELARRLADISESRERRVPRSKDPQDTGRHDDLLQLIRDNHTIRLNEMVSVVEENIRYQRQEFAKLIHMIRNPRS